MDPRTRRSLAERIAARFAGYSGWDPPEEPEDPDPSATWDEAVGMFPHSMRHLFDHPKQHVDRKHEDVAVTLTKLIELGEDTGLELTATASYRVDADEDGMYSHSDDYIEYNLNVYGPNGSHKGWSGTAKDYELSRKFKHDLHEFLAALKEMDPDAAKKAGL